MFIKVPIIICVKLFYGQPAKHMYADEFYLSKKYISQTNLNATHKTRFVTETATKYLIKQITYAGFKFIQKCRYNICHSILHFTNAFLITNINYDCAELPYGTYKGSICWLFGLIIGIILHSIFMYVWPIYFIIAFTLHYINSV